MLQVENLQCGYSSGTIKAVVDVLTFQAESGELLLLAGRNGIGKSTVLRTIAGLQAPLSGQVKIEGKQIVDTDAMTNAALVSVMFSTPPELAMTTCGEVVLTAMQRNFSVFQRNFEKEEVIVKESLAKTGMENFYQRDFASLSDGEKQKVMLSRCLAQNTPVLVLDEPLAFLDYPSRRSMLELLENIAKQDRKTIIYSSHDLDISLQHCDKLLLLESGGKWKYFTDRNEISKLDPVHLF